MQTGRKSAWFLILAVVAGLLILTYLEYRAFRSLPHSGPRPPEEKRNVYVITATGLRPDHLSSYLYQSIQTPAMDFMAYDGVRFVNGWTTSPESLPAHLALLSGIYPFRKPVSPLLDYYYSRTTVRPQQTGFTMPEWFRRKGYLTAAFLADPDLRIPTLFSGIFDSAYYGDRKLASWEPSYDARDVSLLASEWIARNASHPHLILLNLNEPTPPYAPPPPFDRHYLSHPYDGEIAAVDEQIGLFINRLKKAGLFERSILIFAAPYAAGPEGSAPPVELKDESLRIPIFVAAPGILPRQKEYLSPASLVDLFPTVLGLLEMEPAGLKFDGVQLFKKDSGREASRDFVFGASFSPMWLGMPAVYFVRSPGWKLISGAKDEMFSGSGAGPVSSEAANRMAAEMRAQLEQLTGPRKPARGPAPVEVGSAVDAAREALALKNPREAARILEGARDLPSSPALLWLRAEIAGENGRLPEALSLLQQAQRASPSPEAHAAQARVRLQALQFREARDLMQRYVKASLSVSYYDYHTIGMIEAGLGNCAAAEAEFEKVLRSNPGFADAHYRLGLCQLTNGDEPAARAAFRAAADLDPLSAEPSRAAVALMMRGPQPADAEPYLRRLLQLDPADYDAMLRLAQLNAAAGDSPEMTRLAHEVLTRSQNPVLAAEARKLIAGE